ncbi:nucleotidyltransferase family protein [Bradyrhizobium prioriisuperbiae]|uniref:nucleotidyltransferase family protein n=1 Tax=Bradyrhizobium prioriisuperbiae TaxID=2854389 RepID=UPI0028EC2EA4|nr:nucleotidyltransferase family protein [Bradyrhizobium prioritasuperba]
MARLAGNSAEAKIKLGMIPVIEHTGLLSEQQRLVLRAATGSGQSAIEAFQRWRALMPLDAIEHSALRVIPLLLALVKREGLDDPDLRRMKGIERHIWASNTLRFKQLFQALTAIRRAGAPFVVLKGAALFATMPEIAALRTSGDYDVLVDPSHMGAVRRELEAAGFTMKGFSFDDLDGELQSSTTGSAPITLVGSSDEVDIHWRVLPNLRDPKLTERIIRCSEEGALHQYKVPIPSPVHQLFTCLARCERWDKDECFTRLLEAYFLLSKCGDRLDWVELERLIAQYRLEAWASAFFSELVKATDIGVPVAVRKPPRPWWFMLKKEWTVRGTPPSERTDLERWLLQYNDARFSRSSPDDWRLTLREALVATGGRGDRSLEAYWRSASRRTSNKSNGRIKFLYGFSFPEKWGRWTDGHWALAIIPLNSEQKKGAPVQIRGHVLNSGQLTRIFMSGGIERKKLEVPQGQSDAVLSLRLQSLEALDGDGLLALWLPDAISPKALGMSGDYRMLSLGIHRIWF